MHFQVVLAIPITVGPVSTGGKSIVRKRFIVLQDGNDSSSTPHHIIFSNIWFIIAPLTVVPFKSEDSFIRSESDYPVKVDAEFLHGSDFIRQDPSTKHVRLDVSSVLTDKSGAIISFKYSGIINVTTGVAAVLGGSKDAKTTEFGDACKFLEVVGADCYMLMRAKLLMCHLKQGVRS